MTLPIIPLIMRQKNLMLRWDLEISDIENT